VSHRVVYLKGKAFLCKIPVHPDMYRDLNEDSLKQFPVLYKSCHPDQENRSALLMKKVSGKPDWFFRSDWQWCTFRWYSEVPGHFPANERGSSNTSDAAYYTELKSG